MNCLYVDNSNVWIEGMHVSAAQIGLAPDIWSAQDAKICDYGWKIDFGRLYEFAGGQASEVGRARERFGQIAHLYRPLAGQSPGRLDAMVVSLSATAAITFARAWMPSSIASSTIPP